jgi:predicted lipoprotein with Yx(FWY)xxD motif
MRSWRLSLLTAVLLLTVAACAGDAGETAADSETTPAEETPAEAESPAVEDDDGTEQTGDVTVAVTSSDLGEIIVDAEGRTLYVFLNDAQGESVCYDECETNWPPLTGMPDAGEGVDASLLGTTERDDGSGQVTYDGWPLYYFAADSTPGDSNGQGVGDVWFVVGPEGEPIQDNSEEEARGY